MMPHVHAQHVPQRRDTDDDVEAPMVSPALGLARPVRTGPLRHCRACGCVSCEFRAARQRRLARTEAA